MLVENESREKTDTGQVNSTLGREGRERGRGEDEMRLRDQSAYEVKREDSAQLLGGKERSEGLKEGKGNKEANDVFGDGRRRREGETSVRGRKTGTLIRYTGRLRGLMAGWVPEVSSAGQLLGSWPERSRREGQPRYFGSPACSVRPPGTMPVGPCRRPPPCAMHCFLFGAGWKRASGQAAGQRWSAVQLLIRHDQPMDGTLR
jgi:hypothetical protein